MTDTQKEWFADGANRRNISDEFVQAVASSLGDVVCRQKVENIAKTLWVNSLLAVNRDGHIKMIDNPHLNGGNIDLIPQTMREIAR